MDYNTARDMAIGFACGGVLLSLYALKQAKQTRVLYMLNLNHALDYTEEYERALREQFPEEFQPRENKPGLVKKL